MKEVWGFTEYFFKNMNQESHFFISGWRLNFGIRVLLLNLHSPPPPHPHPSSSNLFFGVLGGVVLLCQPLLVPGLVSEDPSPIGRSLDV